jgi:glycosyltransferase involved in cell wall biosynthesis
VSGLLVGPGDAQALADALDRLRTDPGRAAELARAARLAVCERFDLHRNAAQLQQLFAQAADTAPDTAALPRMLSRAGVGGAGR